MLSELHIKYWLGIILQIGIMLSIALVLLGGMSFLLHHGSEPLKNNMLLSTNFDIDIFTIWRNGNLYTSIGLIELGLLILVLAQVLRVAMLSYYYTMIRDYWFMLFSFFILSVILYSLIWQ